MLILAGPLATAAERSRGEPGNKLGAVEARIGVTEQWLREARQTETTSTRELREAEQRLVAARSDLARGEAELRTLEQDMARTERAIAGAAATRQRIAAAAAAHLRAMQRSSGGDPLRAMLSADDPSAAARAITYFGYLERSRRDVLQQLRGAEQKLLRDRQQLTRQRASIAERQNAVRLELARIETLEQQRREAIAEVRRGIGERTAELKTLRDERAALRQLIARLERARRARPPKPTAPTGRTPASPADRPSTAPAPTGPTVATLAADTAFARTRGSLPWPVRGLVEARYGAQKGNTSLRWEGLLIRGDSGADVHAVHAGEVAFAGWLRSLGNLLIVDHGGGYLSLYAHLEALSRRVGERVAPGASLGRIGDSGGRDGPALYFEIRHRGNPIDPARWLSR